MRSEPGVYYNKMKVTNIISSSFDLLIESMLIFIPERRISNQQNVKNHTYAMKAAFIRESLKDY